MPINLNTALPVLSSYDWSNNQSDRAPVLSKRAPASVYMLADNLDLALAAGEDLLKCAVIWNAIPETPDDLPLLRAHQRRAIDGIRTFELQLAARVLRSRQRSEAVVERFRRLEPLTNLFTSGTTTLLDLAEDIAKAEAINFETGDTQLAYLRSRGVVEAEVSAPADGTLLPVTEDFLIGGRIRLGTLLDLVATFLDNLDIQFDLYADDADGIDVSEAEAEVHLIQAVAASQVTPVTIEDNAEDESTALMEDGKALFDLDEILADFRQATPLSDALRAVSYGSHEPSLSPEATEDGVTEIVANVATSAEDIADALAHIEAGLSINEDSAPVAEIQAVAAEGNASSDEPLNIENSEEPAADPAAEAEPGPISAVAFETSPDSEDAISGPGHAKFTPVPSLKGDCSGVEDLSDTGPRDAEAIEHTSQPAILEPHAIEREGSVRAAFKTDIEAAANNNPVPTPRVSRKKRRARTKA